MMLEAKEAETKAYYDGLAGKAFRQEQDNLNPNDRDGQRQGSNPLETIFTLNLRESLLSFSAYHAQVVAEKEGKLSDIKKKYAV